MSKKDSKTIPIYNTWSVGNVRSSHGLYNIYLYEFGNEQPVEIHYLGDYITNKETTLSEIEAAFKKEIRLYHSIKIEYLREHGKEIYEYNKMDKRWYLIRNV